MVEAFDNWCFDQSRQPGDSDVVKTEYGYHIMYFVNQLEKPYWYVAAESDYINSIYSTKMDEAISKYEVVPNYNNIAVNELPDISKLQQAVQATE